MAQEILNMDYLNTKAVLTAREAAAYMGCDMSYLYSLTKSRTLPYYKPGGKLLYFRRVEIENWLLHNRIDSESELTQTAMQN